MGRRKKNQQRTSGSAPREDSHSRDADSASPGSTPSDSGFPDSSPASETAAQTAGDEPLNAVVSDPESEPQDTEVPPGNRKQILFPQLPSLSRIMSVVMLVIGILAVGVLFYRLMVGFFVPLFLAALLVVIFRPIHLWIFEKVGRRRRLAAGSTTALILLIVLLPMGILVSVATTQFTILLSKMNLSNMSVAMDRVRSQVGLSLPHPEHFRELDRIIGDITVPQADNPQAVQDKINELNQAAAIVTYLQSEVPDAGVAEAAAEIAVNNLSQFSDLLKQSIQSQTIESEWGVSADDTPLPKPPAPATSSLGQIDSETPPPAALDPPSLPESNADEDSPQGSAAETPAESSDVDSLGSQTQRDDSSTDTRPQLLVQLNNNERFEQPAVIAAASVRSWMNLLLGGSLRSQLCLIANPDEGDFAALIRMARESLQPRFVRLTSATGSIVAQVIFGLVILVVSVYFFLIDGPVMIRTLMRLSPMDDNYEHQLLMEFDRTSRAVVLASVASALVQGILATIGFWLCDFDQIVLLLFLTSVMALVPFLGAASVWVPCALWLGLVDQRWIAASFLAFYGATVVSSIDNVIKVYVLHGRSQLHPLFALLSVIGGVSVFGPIGILVGPMVVVFLQTLLEILNHELTTSHPEEEIAPQAAG
ncbi:transport facilitation [Rhodopirellula islandica]|uniref:Transport facilitation n=1 Tax=Rhodopirellula islandica TaxID=595434 RepID=A0A0J1BD25_RHOIS|nr:AI-2E family transporter [Rhodopirellula islandica]KLU04500.1 transport facilitation [Rhodopirellula islandica]